MNKLRRYNRPLKLEWKFRFKNKFFGSKNTQIRVMEPEQKLSSEIPCTIFSWQLQTLHAFSQNKHFKRKPHTCLVILSCSLRTFQVS